MDLFDFDPFSPNTNQNQNQNQNNNNNNNSNNPTTTTTTASNNNIFLNEDDFFRNINIVDNPSIPSPPPPQHHHHQQPQPSPPQYSYNNPNNNNGSYLNPFDDLDLLVNYSSPNNINKQFPTTTTTTTTTTTSTSPLSSSSYNFQQQQQREEEEERIQKQIENEIHNIEETKFYVEKFEKLLMELLDSTVIQSAIQSEKQKNEMEIRELYKKLWSFHDSPVQVQDYCPCGSLCKKNINNKYYSMNKDIAKQLSSILIQNHTYNTTEVIASFFTQTLNQHRLNYYIYKFIDINNLSLSLSLPLSSSSSSSSSSLPSQPQPNIESLQNIITVLESVIRIFKQLKLPDSLQTIVNQLSLYLFQYVELVEGGVFNNTPQRQRQRGMTLFNDLLNIDSIDTSNSGNEIETINKEIGRFTISLKENLDPEFLEWGYTLVHPSFIDIFQNDWLIKLFDQTNNGIKRPLSESQYINLLLQIDFTKLDSIDFSNLNNNIIFEKLFQPLQNALSLSISKNMLKLSIIVSKILAILTYYFKNEYSINILFKSIWPSQLIGCTVLPMVNWSELSLTTLNSMFCDVYQLTITPSSYYSRSFNDKSPIRNQFFHTIFRYQYLIDQCYQKDSIIAELNNSCKFPQLLLLRRIAQFSSNINDQQQTEDQQQSLLLDGGLKFDLSRLIFDELFYFAFITRPQHYLNIDANTGNLIQSLWPIFKSEIYSQLFILLQSQPHLVNRFMFNVSQNLLYLDMDSFCQFIDPSNVANGVKSQSSSSSDPNAPTFKNYNNPLYFWNMSGDGLHWLALILSHKMIPTLPDSEFTQPDCLFNLVIEPLFFTSAANEMVQFQLSPQNIAMVSLVVQKILSTCNWNQVTSISKLKMILFLLGSRKYLFSKATAAAANSNIPTGAIGSGSPSGWINKFMLESKILLSKETNIEFINQLIAIDSNKVDFNNDGGVFLFIQILLSLQLANVYIESKQSDIQEAYNILARSMPKINLLCSGGGVGNSFEYASIILCTVVYVFKSTPFIVQQEFDQIFRYITLSRNEFISNGLNVFLNVFKLWFTSSPQFFDDDCNGNNNSVSTIDKNITAWVYLLKLNLQTEENITVLNYLFSGCYFKSLKQSLYNHGNGNNISNTTSQLSPSKDSNGNNSGSNDLINQIIDSLLLDTPDIIPPTKTILKLSDRRPWVSYLFARGYVRGRQGVSSALRKESMVLFKDLAIQFKVEPISMIFWEQFWVIYYDGIIASKGVDTLSTDFKNSLIASAVHPYTKSSYKGPINPMIKKIFESFESWSLQSNLPYQRRLVHPQNTELYNLLYTSVQFHFNDPIDFKKYQINQKQWLSNQNFNLSPSQLINKYLLINKLNNNSSNNNSSTTITTTTTTVNINKTTEEFDKYNNFMNTCKNIQRELLNLESSNQNNHGKDNNNNNIESLKFLRDIRQYLGQSKSLSKSILQDDKEFLSLSEKLYTTDTNDIVQTIKCSYPGCIGVNVSLKLSNSVNNENIAIKISDNRKQFTDDYYNFFEKIHQLSILLSMMEDDYFINQFSKVQKQKENLFKFLVSLMSDYQDSIPHKSIFIPFFIEISLKVGKVIIDQTNNQYFLIDTFLPTTTTTKSSPNQESNSISINQKDYSIFIKLFQPSKIQQVVEYVDIFQRVITTLPSILSQNDLKKVILSFKLNERIPSILALANGKNCLLNILQFCIKIPILIDIVELISAELLKTDMILIFNIFDILLDDNNGNGSSDLLICNVVNGKKSTLYRQILSNPMIDVNQQLQQQRVMQISSMIEYLTNPKSAIASITTIFLLNNILSYDFITSPMLDGHLNNTRDIVINSIKSTIKTNSNNINSGGDQIMPIQDFKLSIELLSNLIKVVPKSINLLWDVFYNSYVPLLESFNSIVDSVGSPSALSLPTSISSDNYFGSVEQQQFIIDEEVDNQYLDVITNFFGMLAIDGHLSSAVFHIISSDTLEQMNYIISETIFGNIVVILFSILDWSLLFKQSKITNKTALNYLKLCMYISIVNGTKITSPEFKLALASDGNLDWFKCGDLSEASLIFDGSSFVKLLTRSSLVQSNQQQSPNTLIMNCLTLFKDITLLLDNYSLATALALEIRSLIYLVVQTPTAYWHLEYTEQESLLKTILLPLIRSLADNQILKNSPTQISGSQQRMKSILKVTLSCLDDISYPMKSNIKFAKFPVSGLSNENHANKELYGKISALIQQFCASCSTNLCLQILSCAHLTLNQSLSNYCKVIDNILRSFYSIDTNKSIINHHDEDEGNNNNNNNKKNNNSNNGNGNSSDLLLSSSSLINKYLVFPNNENPSKLLKVCIQENCHLLMYVVAIQSQRNDTLNLSEFLQDVINITFRNNHEYELWLSWMLGIKLISNLSPSDLKNKLLIQSISDFKSSIQSYFGTTSSKITLFFSNRPKPIMIQTHLASRACLLYLQRIMVQRKGEKSVKDDQLLTQISDSFIEMKKKSNNLYAPYQDFFNESENFLSSLVEFEFFSTTVIKTLVPFANYLLNILSYE